MTSKTLSQLTKDTWEKMADDYISYRNSGESMNELVEIPAMEKLVGRINGLNVLDAGCGHGHYSIWAKKNGAKTVIGVDISAQMIKSAIKNAEKENLEIEFIQEDLSNLKNIRNGSFDLIMSSIVVNYFDDLIKYFSEFNRILKKGGKFVFSEVHPMRSAGEKLTIDGKDHSLVKNYLPSRITKGPGWKDKKTGDVVMVTYNHRTIEDFSKALKKTGFLIEEISEPSLSEMATDEQKKKFERSTRIPVFILFKAIKI